MKTVLITGASTGIGRAAAQHLAESGWRVFAGVRKESDGDALKSASANILPTILDVTNEEHIQRVTREIELALGGDTLAGLVNNAGVAQMGPLAAQPMDEFKWHFDVNVFGLLALTKAMIPLLGGDEDRSGSPGRIVNITSVGGKIASPFLGAYVATKHAVEALTDSLRRELVVYGIDAISVGPGAVQTPIWEKGRERPSSGAYDDTPWKDAITKFVEVMGEGGETGLPPEQVARVIETALVARKPKARYAPVPNKLSNFTIASRLPKRTLDKVFWKRFGLQRSK